jgi:ABC-2 type transport system permease protein
MRLVAEERRVGTWELLLASPVSSFELAKGKILSSVVFLCFVLMTTFPLVLVLEFYASVDYGAVASGYLGLLLLGVAVMSTGLVVSALATSQTVAYLVTAFVWLTLSLSMKVLPAYVPTKFADIFFAIDPDLRMSAFSIGLIDTANIVYFLSISLSMGWIAVVVIERTRQVSSSIWKIILSGLMLLVSIGSINSISLNNNFRLRIDATGSRSYTLSDQSSNLLQSIDEPWKIVILLDESRAGRSVTGQVDEVLRRYSEGSKYISVQRIDPSNPSSIGEYDTLLRELMELYGDELTQASAAIQEGMEQFRGLMRFASSSSVWAQSLSEVPSSKDEQETLRTLAGALSLLGSEGSLILDEVDKVLRIDESQPLPQIALARDILVAATGQWSRELAEVAWWLSRGRSESIAESCSSEATSFEEMAAQLALVDDTLRRLGELELGHLATQLTTGEGAIILSQSRATMIPASMLFPKQIGGANTIAVDQRFRGEQIISSAMRSLQSDVLPTVVFVHAEKNSLLGQRQNNNDVRAAMGLLEMSRFGVEEWIPFDGRRPTIDDGPIVWIVIPPSSRVGFEPSLREQKLLDAVEGLIAEGEPVMLNVQPSLLPRYGQPDPWNVIAESVGITLDTERVLVERVAIGPNNLEVQRSQMINRTNSEHVIARAVEGRQVFIPLPISMEGGESLIVVNPSDDRWLDSQWEREVIDIAGKIPLEEDVTIAAATKHHGGARAVVVGSGGWLLSWASDRAVSLGGGQVAMVNPGNSELLLACVEWLSGLDDWIAAGPIGQQSSRVDGLSRPMYLAWTGILVLGIPLLLLASALFISMRRYRQ